MGDGGGESALAKTEVFKHADDLFSVSVPVDYAYKLEIFTAFQRYGSVSDRKADRTDGAENLVSGRHHYIYLNRVLCIVLRNGENEICRRGDLGNIDCIF